jgi:hypothetical protein
MGIDLRVDNLVPYFYYTLFWLALKEELCTMHAKKKALPLEKTGIDGKIIN